MFSFLLLLLFFSHFYNMIKCATFTMHVHNKDCSAEDLFIKIKSGVFKVIDDYLPLPSGIDPQTNDSCMGKKYLYLFSIILIFSNTQAVLGCISGIDISCLTIPVFVMNHDMTFVISNQRTFWETSLDLFILANHKWKTWFDGSNLLSGENLCTIFFCKRWVHTYL